MILKISFLIYQLKKREEENQPSSFQLQPQVKDSR